MHSPARYSKRTVHTLMRVPIYNYQISSSFNSRSRVLFSFPSRYCYSIGLDLYLGLEVDVPQIHAPFPRYTNQELVKVLNASLTGLSPSKASHSREFQITYEDQKNGPITPHVQYISAVDSVCPVLFSVALTYRIPIGFFSCGY